MRSARSTEEGAIDLGHCRAALADLDALSPPATAVHLLCQANRRVSVAVGAFIDAARALRRTGP